MGVPNGRRCNNDRTCKPGYCRGDILGTGCYGTCTKQSKEGAKCNWPLGDDAECIHKCTCRACTNAAGKNRDGKNCDNDGECASGYCSGVLPTGCFGTCKKKKKEGQGCDKVLGDDAECVHACTCGACTNSAGKNRDGKSCDKDRQCASGYCKGNIGFLCTGRCTRKKREGEGCSGGLGNDAQCIHKCTCGACTNSSGRKPYGKCNTKRQCRSNRCGKWWQPAFGCIRS